MASLSVPSFDHEDRPIQFDTWLDDLQLYLLSDYRDSVSLFDHTPGASLAPPATANSATHSQWLTRDAAARLAVRNHLPLAERAHSGQHKFAKAMYDVVVARYSSPATAALGRLMLAYLIPELSAFAKVEDLVTHLRTSKARYCAALPAKFLDRNPPPMYITLYFIVTRLPDPLRAVWDHFLALDLTVLIADLLEQHLLAVETSVVARLSSKGKGGRSGGGGSGGSGGGGTGGGGGSGGGGSGGSGGGSGGFGGGGGGSGGGSGSGGSGSGGSQGGAVQRGGSGGGQRQQQRRSETPSPQQLREWLAQRGASGGTVRCPYVIRTGDRAGQTCGKFHSQHRCFSRLDDAWRAEFGDKAEHPRWAELLRSGVDIFALDYDAILAAMYALSVSAEGDCYRCVLPDPCIEAVALGASESALPGTAPAEALHTFTLDSGASRCFFHDSTTLTPLSALGPVTLADPSGGPVLARSSTVLPCPAVPSGSLSGLHLPSFSTKLVRLHPLARVASCRTTALVTPPCHAFVACTPASLLWSSRVSASLPALACPARPSLCRGAAARHSSLLLASPEDCSLADSPHGHDLPVLRLHSDRGGEFSSDLLRDFCREEGILQSFKLPASPQQNGIAERRIGLVMEVARTSMIHAAALHFMWPFAVMYAVHQLNLWPRVSLPETSPTLRWTGKVGDASVFRVSGSRVFVRDPSTDKLSSCAIPCVFLRFPPDASGWQFYHPTSHRVLPSQDVPFDESVLFYCLFPYRTAPLSPPPAALPCSSAARGAASGGAASGGLEPRSAESEGAGSRGAQPGGAEPGGTEPKGAEPGGAE
ncbi:unnamed protein product [Closterium sp. NIES-53]